MDMDPEFDLWVNSGEQGGPPPTTASDTSSINNATSTMVTNIPTTAAALTTTASADAVGGAATATTAPWTTPTTMSSGMGIDPFFGANPFWLFDAADDAVPTADPVEQPISLLPAHMQLGADFHIPLNFSTQMLTTTMAAPPPRGDQRGAREHISLGFGSRMRRVAPRKQGTCQICDSSTTLQVTIRDATTESFNTRSCGHFFCSECLQHYIRVKIDEGTRKIACPAVDCQRTLTVADIKRLAPRHAGRYQGLLSTDYTARAKQDGAELRGIARECPACHVMVAKDGGCDEVSCPCGISFCFVCGDERPMCACRRAHRAHRGLNEALHFNEVHTSINRRADVMREAQAARHQVRELQQTFCDRMRERGVTEDDVREYEVRTSRELNGLSRIGRHVHRMRDMYARVRPPQAGPTFPPHAWELANRLEKCRQHAARVVDRAYGAAQSQVPLSDLRGREHGAPLPAHDDAINSGDQLPAKRARTTTTTSTSSSSVPSSSSSSTTAAAAVSQTTTTTTTIGHEFPMLSVHAPPSSSSSVAGAGRRQVAEGDAQTKRCTDTRVKFDALVKNRGRSEGPCPVLSQMIGADAEWPILSGELWAVTTSFANDDDDDDGDDDSVLGTNPLSFAVGPAAWSTPALHHTAVPMTWVVSKPTSDVLQSLHNLAVQCLQIEQTLVESGRRGRPSPYSGHRFGREEPRGSPREMADARRQLRALRAKEADIRTQLEEEGHRHRLLFPPDLVELGEPTVFDEHMELLLHMKRDVDGATQNLRSARHSLLHVDIRLVDALRRHIRDRHRIMEGEREEGEDDDGAQETMGIDTRTAPGSFDDLYSAEPEFSTWTSADISSMDVPSRSTRSTGRAPSTSTFTRVMAARAAARASASGATSSPATTSLRPRARTAKRKASPQEPARPSPSAGVRAPRLTEPRRRGRAWARSVHTDQRRQLRAEARRRARDRRPHMRGVFGRMRRQGAMTLQHAEQLRETVEREVVELRSADESRRGRVLEGSRATYW